MNAENSKENFEKTTDKIEETDIANSDSSDCLITLDKYENNIVENTKMDEELAYNELELITEVKDIPNLESSDRLIKFLDKYLAKCENYDKKLNDHSKKRVEKSDVVLPTSYLFKRSDLRTL